MIQSSACHGCHTPTSLHMMGLDPYDMSDSLTGAGVQMLRPGTILGAALGSGLATHSRQGTADALYLAMAALSVCS